MLAYDLVKSFYGERTAKRSGVKLINHIDEGISILKNSDNDTIGAYCLHPLLQSDSDLAANWRFVCSAVSTREILLAMEYRNIANAYLSTRVIKDVSEINLGPLVEVREMLIADKMQNYKDFEIYHKDTHPRSAELDVYFKNWLVKLDIVELYTKWREVIILAQWQ